MKFVLNIFVFIAIAQFKSFGQVPSCTNPKFHAEVKDALSHTVPTIDVGQAHATFNNYIFLDAREIEEYNISHIPQARYIGYNSFDIKSIKDIPKNKQIIVYCSIGYRSEKIGEKLMKAGYLHVYNLYGSIFEWANRSLPLLDKSGKRTNLVHTYNKQWSKFVTNPKITKRY